MKKKLESELISIAHRILKLKGKEDVFRLHEETRLLYEKLSVLKFAHDNFDDAMPTIGNDSSFFGMLDTAFNNKISDTIEVEDKIYINLDDVADEEIAEPVMNKIKDMVELMPDKAEETTNLAVKQASKTSTTPNEFERLTADFRDLPEFEPLTTLNGQNGHGKKSLNDRIKSGGLNIGLNDKIAFIKHLFNGNSSDYDRVISQLNTLQNFKEAQQFINTMVKPDYNHWLGKDEFETRLMEIVEAKFN